MLRRQSINEDDGATNILWYESLPMQAAFIRPCLAAFVGLLPSSTKGLPSQTDGCVDGGIIETGKPVEQIRVDMRIARKEGVQLRSFACDFSHQHLIFRGHGQFRGETSIRRDWLLRLNRRKISHFRQVCGVGIWVDVFRRSIVRHI